MDTFDVHVTIENKPSINDPEGETILRDLVIKGGTTNVSQIRTAKMLKFTIEAKDKKTASGTIKKLCDELRIYNPLVSTVTVEVHSKIT